MNFHFILQLKDTTQLCSLHLPSSLSYLVTHSCELLVIETPLVLSLDEASRTIGL